MVRYPDLVSTEPKCYYMYQGKLQIKWESFIRYEIAPCFGTVSCFDTVAYKLYAQALRDRHCHSCFGTQSWENQIGRSSESHE